MAQLAESRRADALVASRGVEALVLALGSACVTYGALVDVHARVGVLVQLVTGRTRALVRAECVFALVLAR